MLYQAKCPNCGKASHYGVVYGSMLFWMEQHMMTQGCAMNEDNIKEV